MASILACCMSDDAGDVNQKDPACAITRQEGEPWSDVELAKFEEIKPKLNPGALDGIDEVSRLRIVRGLWTNNNGTAEERTLESRGRGPDALGYGAL